MTIDFAAFASRLEAAPVRAPGHERAEGLAVRWLTRGDGDLDRIEDVAIVVHGGGAMMDAGYLHFGSSIVSEGRVAVGLFDLRGHGRSSGPRGTALSTAAVLSDLARMVEAGRARYPGARMHLVGHSSGAGMILNALTGTRRPTPPAVDSVVFVAPELGPFLPGRPTAPGRAFATARLWPFVLNALSGGLLCRQTTAVTLDYPDRMVERGFVRSYSVAMANALTPRHPVRQLSRIAVPALILLAGDDELIPGEMVVSAVEAAANPLIARAVQPGSTHLGILLDDTGRIRAWLAAPGVPHPGT